MSNSLPSSIGANLKEQERALLIDGLRLGPPDTIRTRLFFSTRLFAPGLGGTIQAGQYPIFTAAFSDVGQGYGNPMTYRETNWLSRGRTPDQQNLYWQALQCAIRRGPTDPSAYPSGTAFGVGPGEVDAGVPLHPVDVVNIAANFTIWIQYLSMQWPLGKLKDFPAPGGQFGYVQASRQGPATPVGISATTTTRNGARGLLPIARNATVAGFERRFKVAQMLQHAEQFQMYLRLDRPLTLLGPNPIIEEGSPQQINDASGAFEVQVGFWAVESVKETA